MIDHSYFREKRAQINTYTQILRDMDLNPSTKVEWFKILMKRDDLMLDVLNEFYKQVGFE